MRHASLRRRPALRNRRARGSVLVAVMLLLLVTMLLAVAGLRTANIEERMASNVRERQTAFEWAEATLRDAEQQIATNAGGPFSPLRPGSFTDDCTNGLCRSAPDAPRWSTFSEADWSGSKTWAYGAATGAPTLSGGSTPPRYAIEYQGTLQPIEPGKPCVAVYLVTARARGASAATEVVLQSIYRHRVGECYAAI